MDYAAGCWLVLVIFYDRILDFCGIRPGSQRCCQNYSHLGCRLGCLYELDFLTESPKIDTRVMNDIFRLRCVKSSFSFIFDKEVKYYNSKQ